MPARLLVISYSTSCPSETCMPSIWRHTHKPSTQHPSPGPQLERCSQAAGRALSLLFPKQEPACSITDTQPVISQDAWGIRDNSQDSVHSSRAVLIVVCFDITFISLNHLMSNANTPITVLWRPPDMRREKAHAKRYLKNYLFPWPTSLSWGSHNSIWSLII